MRARFFFSSKPISACHPNRAPRQNDGKKTRELEKAKLVAHRALEAAANSASRERQMVRARLAAGLLAPF